MTQSITILKIMIICLIFPCLVKGDQAAAFMKGQEFGSQSLADYKQCSLDKIPNYDGDNPSEASLYDQSGSLNDRATAALYENVDPSKPKQTQHKPAKANIIALETQSKHYTLDPVNDPLMKRANSIINNHQDHLTKIKNIRKVTNPSSTEHRCAESNGTVVHKCTMRRIVSLRPIPNTVFHLGVASYRHAYDGSLIYDTVKDQRLDGSRYYSGPEYSAGIGKQGNPFPAEFISRVISSRLVSGSFSLDSNHILRDARGHWGHEHGQVDITYTPAPTEADLIETIETDCTALEKACEDGNCQYQSQTIHEGENTKVLDGLSVKRDWWHKELTFECDYPSANDCQQWRDKGCYEASSTCKTMKNDRCVEWDKVYTCPADSTIQETEYYAGSNNIFCIGGNCADTSYQHNTNLTEAMTKMSMLKEVKKEMGSIREGRVFTGRGLQCSKHIVNFSDCCGLSSGWGEKLSLSRCNENEQQLAVLRHAKRCHMVGTYCADRKPIIGCTMKKTSFCCFDSKLARIVQVQGRSQLGIGWGDADAPNCRPLTLAEFSRINFNNLNLSELFEDIRKAIKIPDSGRIMTQFQTDWAKRLPSKEDLQKAVITPGHPLSMKEQLGRARLKMQQINKPGPYSLDGTPPDLAEREEREAQFVL